MGCVMVVIKITCAPTQHFKCLNPHLDHAAFDAIFISEHNPYKYKQGHCQVSSFGVGGTNGHAIFWGEGYTPPIDVRKIFLNKMACGKGNILTDGSDASQWESKGLSFNPEPGEKYNVIYSKNPVTNEECLIYEKQEPEVDVEPIEFYSITGNHNDWGEDRMIEGDVPGVWWTDVEIPEEGELEFRFLAGGEANAAIGPEITTKKKTGPIKGPAADITARWVISGKEGDLVKIEFFAPADPKLSSLRTITWFKAASSGE